MQITLPTIFPHGILGDIVPLKKIEGGVYGDLTTIIWDLALRGLQPDRLWWHEGKPMKVAFVDLET